jgi:hypothetical protein
METKAVISPKTKIIDLITDYPELEEVLFEISPAFRQLKNPVLRRTVARVTTLQQAALVGGLKVEDLVNRLRIAAGAGQIPYTTLNSEPLENQKILPGWFTTEKVAQSLDARDMLNRGEHPVGQVLADLNNLHGVEIYELIAPFYPAPLIDKAKAIGFDSHVDQVNPEEFRVYFFRSEGVRE